MKKAPIRGRFAIVTCLLTLAAAGLGALAWHAEADAGTAPAVGGGSGPDVTVIYVNSTHNWGVDGGVRGYSVGTTSCNVGTTPVWWCDHTESYCAEEQHPAIAQNLYRLKDGRFEQLGLSWLKHGFLSTNSPDSSCGSCQGPPHGGDQLGVGCTDAYGSSLNGTQPLGMRSEVDATTGEFPYPYTVVGTPSVIDQRIQVAETELDPTLNPGARYWVEGQYVTADDARANNGLNNASYREVTVSAGSFNLNLQGSTVRELPAIYAWQTVDPAVEIQNSDFDKPTQRFVAARRFSLANGTWHYEFAVHNLNSDRSARSFNVQFPTAVNFSNVGFHDVDHHSGEPWDTTDWTASVNGASGSISWSTDTFNDNPDANALRWGTMFSFWFDADTPPDGAVHTVGLFKPGSPSELLIPFDESPTAVFQDGFESGDLSHWEFGT